MKRILMAMAVVLAVAGCSSDGSDSEAGGGSCSGILAAGEVMSADDVEICKAGPWAGFTCPDGRELFVVEVDGAEWSILEGAAPAQLPASKTVDDVHAPCG